MVSPRSSRTPSTKRDDMTQPSAGSGSGAFGASDTPDAVPVCPRHPDTAAYTRCQRCGRPACPRCQIPASVGFQCVDCVAAERKTNPTFPTRSSLGMTTGAAAQGRPVVTIGIIALCCLVWLGQLASDALYRDVAFIAVFIREQRTVSTSLRGRPCTKCKVYCDGDVKSAEGGEYICRDRRTRRRRRT